MQRERREKTYILSLFFGTDTILNQQVVQTTNDKIQKPSRAKRPISRGA